MQCHNFLTTFIITIFYYTIEKDSHVMKDFQEYSKMTRYSFFK